MKKQTHVKCAHVCIGVKLCICSEPLQLKSCQQGKLFWFSSVTTLLPSMKHKHLGACKRLKIFLQLIKAWSDFWKYEVVFFPCAVTFSLRVYDGAAEHVGCGMVGLPLLSSPCSGQEQFLLVGWINTSDLGICWWWSLPLLPSLLLVCQKFRKRFQASNCHVLVTFVLEAISFSKLFL